MDAQIIRIPTYVVVVHDQPTALDELSSALGQAGHDVAAFNDPMAALGALDTSQRIDILVTSVDFSPGTLHGIALARMAQAKRPLIKVVFAAGAEFAEFAEGFGIFMPTPLNVRDVVKTVESIIDPSYKV